MGFFDWLLDTENEHRQALPKPTRPAPPMPAVAAKPNYNEVINEPPNISEPVITLLEMLGRDEWEYSVYNAYHSSTSFVDVILRNVFKEDVTITWRNERSINSWCKLPDEISNFIKEHRWMTPDEVSVVVEAVKVRWGVASQLNTLHKHEVERLAFQLKLKGNT